MNDRVLMLATTAAMIEQFNKNNIQILNDLGYSVDVIGNFDKGNPISRERLEEFKGWITERKGRWYNYSATRNPLDFKNNIKAYKTVVKLINEKHYCCVHCHTPLGAVIGRIAAHKTHTKVIYTAHGFHFYKGAPLKNWLFYYPVEKFLSKWTDILITINNEDYERAQKKFFAKKVVKIPGVGINIKKLESCKVNRDIKRNKLGIPKDSFVLLSVGELSDRKNQQVVIEAMRNIKTRFPEEYPNIFYLLAGQGPLEKKYKEKIQRYGLQEHVILLGFRNDIAELCKSVDCFVHPSVREGLGIAPLEAMATGLPLISSYINGIKDYTQDGKTGICIANPKDIESMTDAIMKLYRNPELRKKTGNFNYKEAQKFDIKKTNAIMRKIYKEISA